jgi:hypothetical protein
MNPDSIDDTLAHMCLIYVIAAPKFLVRPVKFVVLMKITVLYGMIYVVW